MYSRCLLGQPGLAGSQPRDHVRVFAIEKTYRTTRLTRGRPTTNTVQYGIIMFIASLRSRTMLSECPALCIVDSNHDAVHVRRTCLTSDKHGRASANDCIYPGKPVERTAFVCARPCLRARVRVCLVQVVSDSLQSHLV